jgi:ribonuclease BN (tRNA processing enzyme)
MRVTVLGKSPSWQDAGGACSGYLIEHGEVALLLDCGNGVFSKLRLHLDYVDVDAVVISHMHADHFLDLVPFAYALTYAPRQQPVPVERWPGTDDPARPELHLPEGGAETLRGIVGSWGPEDLIDKAFRVEEYDTRSTVRVGELEARFHPVPHFTETFAINLTTADGSSRLTFGADCRPGPEIVDAARDTDLLIVEATLPRPERSGERGHLTPYEAGEHARLAGAKRVVLTHISDELDAGWAREQGSEGFGAPVEVASEGAVYEI